MTMPTKPFPGTTLGQLRAFLVAADPGDTILIPNDVVDGSDLPGQTWTTVPIKDNITIIGTKSGGKVRIGGNGSSQVNFALVQPMLRSVNDTNPLEEPDKPIDGITIENILLIASASLLSHDIRCLLSHRNILRRDMVYIL
ncbi:hypothetical protein AGMMS49992_03110 [Clostridia bacterium]|nr:hypothetical protein AGMMS49992_03110 [Clostridia bacterium]